MTPRLRYVAAGASLLFAIDRAAAEDFVSNLQAMAVGQESAPWGHWGPDAQKYSSWTSHSNRLIPIYVFGGDLRGVAGEHSIYRDAQKLEQLYGRLPSETVNPQAEYFDQTDVYRLQKLAAEAGKKHIVLIVFDGMDWQTTWAAATYRAGHVAYREGRGTGLYFQDYRGTATDFGYFVTAPNSGAARLDVDAQRVVRHSRQLGGYNADLGGSAPWSEAADPQYPIGRSEKLRHMYTDSASSATSMTSGVKTYNDAINVDHDGRPCTPIARELQAAGYAVGVVTSVPISHATPGCAYANNVGRDDYQDITRDLLGLPSASHEQPLPGVDVLLGAGWGEESTSDRGQGENFVAGNRYLAAADFARADVENGGPYVVVQREPGADGAAALKEAAESAKQHQKRLVGFFGVQGGHLPFQTADGAYDPTRSVGGDAETYSKADVRENPTLADMAETALDVLSARSDRFWLMIEAGDVDWANHQNNIDNSIGAVQSGDDAFRKVTEWMERNDAWGDSLVLVTADHGHYLVLSRPEMLAQGRANDDAP
jgi:alkaline phosphatase